MFQANNLAAWLTYLETLSVTRTDLAPLLAVKKKLNLPDFSGLVITVGGTNGKGSTVAMLESIYLAAGYETAAYFSPHLLSYTERLRLSGIELAESAWVEAFNALAPHVEKEALSYFDYTTLAAFYLIAQKQPQIVLLEVGLGGRLDAVNGVDSALQIITSIALDHTELLGQDREAIATEKAGIFRTQSQVICAEPCPPQSLQKKAQDLNAKLHQIHRDFELKKTQTGWTFSSNTSTFSNLSLPPLKLSNIAAAVQAVQLLQTSCPVSESALRLGLTKTVLAGRFERFTKPCNLILDVAHNPASAAFLAEQLKAQPISGKTYAVVGFLQNKDQLSMCKVMAPFIDAWYCATLDSPRSMLSADLCQIIETVSNKICYNSLALDHALHQASAICGEFDRIVVWGSFITVALTKKWLQHRGYA